MQKTISYTSTCKSHLSIVDQQGLIEGVSKEYAKLGVTGIFIKKDHMCFQIIEGETSIINSIYKHIKRDSRHKDIIEIVNQPIKKSIFNDFYSGYCITADINSLYGIHKYIHFLEKNPSKNEDLFYDIIENLLLQSA